MLLLMHSTGLVPLDSIRPRIIVFHVYHQLKLPLFKKVLHKVGILHIHLCCFTDNTLAFLYTEIHYTKDPISKHPFLEGPNRPLGKVMSKAMSYASAKTMIFSI